VRKDTCKGFPDAGLPINTTANSVDSGGLAVDLEGASGVQGEQARAFTIRELSNTLVSLVATELWLMTGWRRMSLRRLWQRFCFERVLVFP